jgi:hypothetical protein
MTAVQVIVIAAESGDLDLIEDVTHQNHAEMGSYAAGTGEEIHDAVGARIGSDIEILRLHPEQQVAHATADQPGLMAGAAQFGDDLAGERFRVHLPMLI